MARHLFIAQQTLSTWMDQDKIRFDGHVMTILADGRQFQLVEAVRFIKVEGGDEDTAGLIGKVKTDEQLVSMGAERYCDSVIFRDLAFKVQEGFIGEVFLKHEQAEEEEGEAKPTPPAAQAKSQAGDGEAFTLLPRSAVKSASRPASACEEPVTLTPKATRVASDPPGEGGDRNLDVARTQPSMPAVSPEKATQPAGRPAAGEPQRIVGSASPSGQGAPGKPAPDSQAAATSADKPTPNQAPKGGGEEELSDEELLTRFLLENL